MLTKLEQGLGYTFRNKALLENALTHSSYANENRERHLPDNERLEFLGDSILGFVVAEYLYRNFPDKPEGELTRIRADLVCERNLAEAAATIELGSYLLLGHGEEQGGGRKRDSIVSDAMESVIAASFMDGGFAAAKEIIDRRIRPGSRQAFRGRGAAERQGCWPRRRQQQKARRAGRGRGRDRGAVPRRDLRFDEKGPRGAFFCACMSYRYACRGRCLHRPIPAAAERPPLPRGGCLRFAQTGGEIPAAAEKPPLCKVAKRRRGVE